MKVFCRIILVFVFFLLFNDPVAIAQFQEAGVKQFKIPVEAPDFTLKELSGSKISFREFRGKIVVLNFFTTW